MRVLQINSAKTFGGGERHFTDLAAGLKNAGCDVYLCVAENSPIPEKLPDFPPEKILQTGVKNSLDYFAARRIARFIKEKDIEIVHAHTGKDYLPASLAARFAGAKLVLTRHVLFPLKPLQKFALGNAAKVIAVSGAVEEVLGKTFPQEKIVKIHNGINTEHWSEKDAEKLKKEFRFFHNIPFDAFLVATIGELKILKGQRDFVLAANEVAKKTDDVFFIVVGTDNTLKKDFRRELKKLVKVFGLEKRFLFLDWLEDTAPLLAATDVFVSASHTESFGLAILEAMASGKAIVATETEGAKELLEDGKTGELAEIKNAVRLAEKIEKLINDENLREKCGKNAKTAAAQKFSLEKMIGETRNVYRSILD